MTMAADMVFYHWPRSRARMVHWMLEEVGATYRVQLVNLDKGEHKQSTFLAINPMGKLPALVHRGTVITETGAIIDYLADEFPAAGLAPRIGDPTRGAYLLGPNFSAADLYVGAQLGFGLMTRTLEPRPAFQALLARVTARPAYARAIAQDEALMAGVASAS